jgi:signal transduction histidine kinase
MTNPANPSRGDARIALGAGLLVASGLLLVRASGPWPGDAIVWPAAVAVMGALLIWRAPGAIPQHRRGWAAHVRREPFSRNDPVARMRALGRPQVSRLGLGVTLVLAAGIAFLWANGAVRPAGETVLALAAAAVALALIFAPSWRRLARSLQAERTERIRTQERADVGAHLHDSVLQTLALIQRSADDPQRVATLARQQERELRAWLADGDARRPGDRLGAALQAAGAEVEAAAGATVELVTVGDCRLDAPAAAVLGAAREAMLNAVKFGAGSPVSVYAELSRERIVLFVRDRGPGFDPHAMPDGRRGVRESIIGRMRRAGGEARLRSSPGGGTEVEITIDRGARA